MSHEQNGLQKLEMILEEPGESLYRDSTESYRKIISPDGVLVPKTPPRILLVDDDPVFGKIMKRAAERKSLSLTYCQSDREIAKMADLNFDVILMDFDLGSITGFELTKRLEQLGDKDLSVILVSQTKQQSSKQWPRSIREFIHKSLGPFAILDAAIEAHEIRRIHRNIRMKHSVH